MSYEMNVCIKFFMLSCVPHFPMPIEVCAVICYLNLFDTVICGLSYYNKWHYRPDLCINVMRFYIEFEDA